MKHTGVALTIVCSLLCMAVSQSVYARSIRADTGQNGWVTPGAPYTQSTYGLTPGVTTPFAASYSNSGPTADDIGLNALSGIEYNWYPSSTSNIQAAEDQILVYQLDANTATLASNNSPYSISSGDIEVEFNYDYVNEPSLFNTSNATANFTIGNEIYSANVSQIYTLPNDFLFDQNGNFLGSLVQSVDANGDNIVSVSSSLGGWTETPTAAAPEMDASSGIAALTLLMGVLTVIQSRTTPRIAAGRAASTPRRC